MVYRNNDTRSGHIKLEKKTILLVPIFIMLNIFYQFIYQNIIPNLGSTVNQNDLVNTIRHNVGLFWLFSTSSNCRTNF
ncbi:protein of unknown function [Latilactobacillus sakei]|nr:hypothetical protein LSAJ160_120003 [Latilactobacillus sakei]SOB42331.1 hypothetical protein LSAJ112_110099 [Latilactobacillus sakei]SON64806.1 protein of unknown function [Latilactobacillus sakei]